MGTTFWVVYTLIAAAFLFGAYREAHERWGTYRVPIFFTILALAIAAGIYFIA